MTCLLKQEIENSSDGLRSPGEVMNLKRLGSLYPTRLSFTRTLLRRMVREKWKIQRTHFDLDPKGIGTAIYRIDTAKVPLWFIVFSDDLYPKDRTDRVIAEKWDSTFTLSLRAPSAEYLQVLKDNVPFQEAGRFTPNELILSRANKSVRLFDYVADKLASGSQPDPEALMKVGYLLRTTAVYGNGKFGLSDLGALKNSGLFRLPFQPEMLCVFLARTFSFDWVEHVAYYKNPRTFKPLDTRLKKALGVGNATGLGMAPFLINHPKLICRWIMAREKALRTVRDVRSVDRERIETFRRYLVMTKGHMQEWPTTDATQKQQLKELKTAIAMTLEKTSKTNPGTFWDNLITWASTALSVEGQELINSLAIELYPSLVDPFEELTTLDEKMIIEPNMSLDTIITIIKSRYSWVLDIDFKSKASKSRFWYRSEEKEEPRLGWRYLEPGADKEMRLGIAETVKKLYEELSATKDRYTPNTVAAFLGSQPGWREIIMRIQSLKNCPYAEIQANLLEERTRPIDLLRCKLAMFGATKFDPKSDLWIRIALFQGAPLWDQINEEPDQLFSFSPLGH